MHETLSAMDCDVRPSEWWTRRFLPGLGLSHKEPNHDKLVWHSLAAERKDNLMLKICWFQETFNIPPSHTVDIDETSLRLLPLRRVGWLRAGEQARAITWNEKEATTMTMSPEVFTFLAEVMHKGKTSAVLPPRPWREGVLHSISVSSWQHTEGIIDFIASIDERFNPEGAASPDAKVRPMAPRVGFGEHSRLGSHTDDTEGEFSMGEPVLHSCEQHRIQPAIGCRCVQGLQE